MANYGWRASTTPFPTPRQSRKLYGFLAGIAGGSRAPVWPGFTFPNGVVGVSYSYTFDLAPATPPVTYTLVSGSLPTGLTLSNVTGAQGRISGTPTIPGTYSPTLRATNSYGTADRAFSITIVTGGSGGAWTWVS